MKEAPQFYFINNRIVPADEAALQLSDLGLFRGYGVFDYFRTHGGKPFMPERYLKRFRESGSEMGLELSISDEGLKEIINDLIELNGRKESGVRLLLTGGYSENIFTPGKPNLIIRIEKSILPDETFYTQGIKLVSTVYLRDLPTIKTANYLHAIKMWPQVEAAGAIELLYTWNENILECSRSNFFVVENGILVTAPAGQVLAGVTRARVIELARELSIPVEERPLAVESLKSCQEAFISGTTKRIMPVVRVDEQQIGSGRPGAVTIKLLEEWNKLEWEIARPIW